MLVCNKGAKLRFLLLFLLFFNILIAESISTKITQSKNALDSNKKEEKKINAKLQELGTKITTQEKESKILAQGIQEIKENIAKNQQEYDAKNTLIKDLSGSQENLFKKRKEIELEIVDLLLKDISFVLLLNDFQPESIRDLIAEESFKTLSTATKEHLNTLATKQSEVLITLQALQTEIKQLKNFIAKENKKKEELQVLQTKQTALIKSYQDEVKQYNKALENIAKERDELQKILVNLNVLKSQEAEKKKKLESFKKADSTQAKKAQDSTIATPQNVPSDFDVRQVASSYHNISTTKYNGAKTIPPLDNFNIQKRFGPYFDPVYKMKVFNESITLEPKGDDKVKSVLDGKVVFAKDTPILKRVVIIEHKNNMHTIYAQLDKIAPTIKPGRSVKKGYTIGRVENALKFEVTLKDKHIDPLELIQTKI